MPNQNQCVRRTAAVLTACGLVVSLLPGFAAAQDLSTVEGRAAWMIEQFRGEPIEPGSKHGAVYALARLALNPNDTEAISSISTFYDTPPAGKDFNNPNMFTLPAFAWVLGKHWDKFTPAQRDHLKSRIKKFTNLLEGGTPNHAVMHNTGGYLLAQYWPDDEGWMNGTRNSNQVREEARKNLLAAIRALYDKSQNENLSTTYEAVHLYPYYALYECARDPEMKAVAEAATTFHVVNTAANHFEGVIIPPFNRMNAEQSNMNPGISLQMICWLYWGEVTNLVPRDDISALRAALSSWRPPAALNSLGLGQTVPYELTSSAASFGNWGTGEPAECVRYVYRDELYAMGSGFFRYKPESYYVNYNAFALVYKSPDNKNFLKCYHPYWYSDERKNEGVNSPFQQWAQHKGAAISLFNIPVADPWKGRGRSDWLPLRDGHYGNLIKEALIRYPKSIDQKTEADGWIFLREGDVYIAIRPLKDYNIDASYPSAGKDFNVIRSASGQTDIPFQAGFVFDVATKEEFPTFEAFQTAVSANPLTVDWNQLSVTYKSVKGDTLTATWNPPQYDVPKGERVLVRPDITVNGTVVPIDSDFLNGKAVMKSPSVELVDRVLRLQTPAGNLEVDWRGEVPKFSNQ